MKNIFTFCLSLFLVSAAFGQAPVIQATGPVDICSGCVTLEVTNIVNGYTYAWYFGGYSCSGSSNAVQIGTGTTVNYCSSGEIYCIATGPGGVNSQSNSINIRILPGTGQLPRPYSTNPVTCMDTVELCIPSIYYLPFPGTTTISWYLNGQVIAGANGPGYTATAAGNYTYSITSPCTTVTSAVSNVFPTPVEPVITSNATSLVCTTDTIHFSVSNPQANYLYTWERFFQGSSYIVIGSGASIDYVVNSNAFDSLRVRVKTEAISCIRYTDDYVVHLQTNSPTINPSGTVKICAGESVQITGYPGSPNPGYQYQWYKNGAPISGANGTSYVTNKSGSYTLATTAACGTNFSSAMNLSKFTLPTTAAAPVGPTTVCKRDTVLIIATAGGTGPFQYQWRRFGADIPGQVSSVYEAVKSGKYTVQVTDANGCKRVSDKVEIVVNPLPVASISASGPTTFCVGDSVELVAVNNLGYTFQWKENWNLITGANNPNYYATQAAKYRCIVTNAFGCTRVTNTIQTVTPCRMVDDSHTQPHSGIQANVYPNPSNSDFTLELTADSDIGMASVMITDLSGRIFEATMEQKSEGLISIKGLAPGYYLINVTAGAERVVLPVVKTE